MLYTHLERNFKGNKNTRLTLISNLDPHLIKLINVTKIGVITEDKMNDDAIVILSSLNGITKIIDLFGERLFDVDNLKASCSVCKDGPKIIKVPPGFFLKVIHARLWICYLRRKLLMDSFDIANYDATEVTWDKYKQFDDDCQHGRITKRDFEGHVSPDT